MIDDYLLGMSAEDLGWSAEEEAEYRRVYDIELELDRLRSCAEDENDHRRIYELELKLDRVRAENGAATRERFNKKRNLLAKALRIASELGQ
jgi:hypothetical protein